MFKIIGEEIYQKTARNGGFPALGYYRVFPKKSFTDENGNLWELVAQRTKSFTLTAIGNAMVPKVRVDGFENPELDGLELHKQDIIDGYVQLKSVLKFLGWPSCTALEIYCAYNKAAL
jgi:hypothetical protein